MIYQHGTGKEKRHMSIQDEIRYTEQKMRKDLCDEQKRREDYSRLKEECKRAGIDMHGYAVFTPSNAFALVINEVVNEIKFRHKVRVVNMSDATRVDFGGLTKVETNNKDIYYYVNTYPSGSNANGFFVHICGEETGKNANPYYLVILEDGRVAMKPHFNRETIDNLITPSELRNRIIRTEANYRVESNKTFSKPYQPPKQTKSSSSTLGGCYIATAVYGSYDCPQVWTLRRFRDNVLSRYGLGRRFIKTYYRISPHLVEKYGESKWFIGLWKHFLDKLVKTLNVHGIRDDKYYD